MNDTDATVAPGGSPPPRVPEDFEWVERPWGPTLACRLLQGFRHGWTTRSMDVVRGNANSASAWQQLAEGSDVDSDAVIRLRQVHGACVVHASGPLHPAPEADAVITREPRVLLSVRVADCVPLLIGHPMSGAVAAVHAGWRGTAAGLARRTVEELNRVFGARPSNLVAALGPSVGPCCYTVASDLREAFLSAGWAGESIDCWFQQGRDTRLDLWRANRDQLTTAGMAPDSIAVSRLCTVCHPAWFHSYRRDRERAGRLIGFIRAGTSPPP